MTGSEHSRCPDAVILVPGLMGSELVDAKDILRWVCTRVSGLGSLDPYSPLVCALRRDILVDGAALHEFACDWRRSIADAAAALARVAGAHLQTWRAHARSTPNARLWLVCHSLGGLVARYFTEVLGGRAITHGIITLGTPFFGSL